MISTILERDLEQTEPKRPWYQEDDLGQFILGSRFFNSLLFIRETCSTLKDLPSTVLDFAVHEAQLLLELQQHVGRIVQQIAHHYPRMAILGLTDPRINFQESILDGLGKSFSSFRAGQGVEVNLVSRMPDLNRNKGVPDYLDPEERQAVDVSSHELYDMVVLSISVLKQKQNPGWTPRSPLKKIRSMTKDGGFLILINVSPTPFTERPGVTVGPEGAQQVEMPPTPPMWLDWLEESDFVSSSKNADQTFPLGFSLSIRQARSAYKNTIRRPLS